VAQLTKHKRFQRSFELSEEGDVRLPPGKADCSTALEVWVGWTPAIFGWHNSARRSQAFNCTHKSAEQQLRYHARQIAELTCRLRAPSAAPLDIADVKTKCRNVLTQAEP